MAFRSAEAVINELADRYAQALFFLMQPRVDHLMHRGRTNLFMCKDLRIIGDQFDWILVNVFTEFTCFKKGRLHENA